MEMVQRTHRHLRPSEVILAGVKGKQDLPRIRDGLTLNDANLSVVRLPRITLATRQEYL